mmetsp:Transcript_10434/g.26539  ORF Transcript_10434/g.26539 Transcript_10434/m.26539 type:complete len:385 (+) Transcript_10434:95-1249(+)
MALGSFYRSFSLSRSSFWVVSSSSLVMPPPGKASIFSRCGGRFSAVAPFGGGGNLSFFEMFHGSSRSMSSSSSQDSSSRNNKNKNSDSLCRIITTPMAVTPEPGVRRKRHFAIHDTKPATPQNNAPTTTVPETNQTPIPNTAFLFACHVDSQQTQNHSKPFLTRIVDDIKRRAANGYENVKKAAEDAGKAEGLKGLQAKAAVVVRDAVESIDADERFLAGIPSNAPRIHITYPENINHTLVRRRCRVLAVKRTQAIHAVQRLVYGGIMLGFSPLMLSPFPNIPVYFCVYRAYMHQSAYAGGRRLEKMLQAWEADSGGCPPPTVDTAYGLHGGVDAIEASSVLADALNRGALCKPEMAEEVGIALGVPNLGAMVELKLRQLYKKK